MITADRNSILGMVCADVDSMAVGQCLKLSRIDLRHIAGFEHNGAQFRPEDRVLENIVGSGFTHSYTVDPMTGDVTFRRHENTGELRYQSPDRRSKKGGV